MSPRAKAKLVAMLLVSPLFAAPPVWASGVGSGGASPGGATATTPTPPPTALPGPPSGSGGTSPGVGTLPVGSLVATASGDGISVTTEDSTLLGNELAFTGITAPKHAGSAVVVQRLNAQNEWIDAATGTVNSDGAFSVTWRSNASGHVTLRAVLERTASATRVGNASPTLQITVYRPGIATFYGAGFFGHKTACGGTLQPDTLGVASRTLKCGTRVELYYQGRTIVVPVIDRGPYANNATWDLTQATAAALGITGTETVGAMKV